MQQVICIRCAWMPFEKGFVANTLPVKDGIYTVRGTLVMPLFGIPTDMLMFDEIFFVKAPEKSAFPCFQASCFRPVKPTSIQIFKDMLNHANNA